MTNEQNISNQETLSHQNEMQNDLLTISNIFCLDKLNYIDISLQQRLDKISAQWPLLAEFMTLPSEQENTK